MRIFLILFCAVLLSSHNTYASGAFSIEDSSRLLIGAEKTHTIAKGESLVELARTFNVGYNEITAANRDIDPWIPEAGTRIVIPTVWLLPEIMNDGILINLAEMRLYYFFVSEDRRYVRTFPIGIGRQGFDSPTGSFRVASKVKDPVWRVPDTIKKEEPELPDFVPPGPENPLGGYWLQLSNSGYGIHGTNRPYGIGRRVSHGCIRLYPEDIKVLFSMVRPGTPVKIIHQEVKTGMHENTVYIEVNGAGSADEELLSEAARDLGRKRLLKQVNTIRIIQAVKKRSGLPAEISE